MEFVVGTIIFAAVMIMVTKVPLAIAMSKLDGGYDNALPRLQLTQLSGFGARARGAHENSIEAFPLFAAGAIVALWHGGDLQAAQTLCAVFIAGRLVYFACYLLDWDKLRSLSWMAGFVASLGLMAQPLMQ
ncbi:MAG: MAPEG family protein [Pseudomonadota bacterium]|nr:MAPEG family protein [Pseudomonadota bacterium]